LRLEAADEDVHAGGGWAEGHHVLATSTSSPPSEVNEPSQNVFAVSAFPMKYANMLQMCAEIPEPHYKCCGERCLHKLECEKPGWIENKKTELQDILKLHQRERSTRMLLRVTRRGRVRKGKRGKPQHPAAYSSAFDELEELLTSRGACQSSRFEFVTKYFAYARYEKTRPRATPASSSSSLMFEGQLCYVQNCLGNVITGTDAVREFMRRRKEATTQAQKQLIVDTFLVTFPGVCKAATQMVLNVGKILVEARLKRLQRGEPPGPSEHGLKEYRKKHPMYRVEACLLRDVNVFLDTYLVGNPVSETRRAHINAIVPVNGKQGLWKMFVREVAKIPQSTFNNVLERWLKFRGFTDLDRAHIDHNV